MVHDCPSIQLFVFNSCKDSKWEINCFKLRRGYERWQEKAKNLRCLLQQVKKKMFHIGTVEMNKYGVLIGKMLIRAVLP